MLGKWEAILPPDICKHAAELYQKAQDERNKGKIIFPSQNNIFRALILTPPENVKVVIVGQDPYHEKGQACGLAFSVEPGTKLPPSLRNIFKELSADIGCDTPASGDLTSWAQQGVLLLNTVLTVEEGAANSHEKWGWKQLTTAIVDACENFPQPIVYMLWGKQAKMYYQNRDENRSDRLALCSSHPSPLSAYKTSDGDNAFLGSKPFSKANAFLRKNSEKEINWSI